MGILFVALIVQAINTLFLIHSRGSLLASNALRDQTKTSAFNACAAATTRIVSMRARIGAGSLSSKQNDGRTGFCGSRRAAPQRAAPNFFF